MEYRVLLESVIHFEKFWINLRKKVLGGKKKFSGNSILNTKTQKKTLNEIYLRI